MSDHVTEPESSQSSNVSTGGTPQGHQPLTTSGIEDLLVHFIFFVCSGALLTAVIISLLAQPVFLVEMIVYGVVLARFTRTPKAGTGSVALIVAGQVLLILAIANAGHDCGFQLVMTGRRGMRGTEIDAMIKLAFGTSVGVQAGLGAGLVLALAAWQRTEWSAWRLVAFGLFHALAPQVTMAVVYFLHGYGIPYSA